MSGRFEITTVPKPWGHEKIWARTERYVGKILHINAGHALSVQYHNAKDETVYLLSGELKYWVDAASAEGRAPSAEGSGAAEFGEASRVLPSAESASRVTRHASRTPSHQSLVDVRLKVGDAFRITPGTVHYMEAVTDCEVLEVSTPELDDVVRLKDRYGREGTSAP
jgi:mannose-6-phosphate isomerase